VPSRPKPQPDLAVVPPETAIGPPSALDLTRDGALVTIDNLDAAAYLLHEGNLAIHRCERLTRTRFQFVIYDPEFKADELLLKWVSSAERRYADCVQAIKSALHGFHRRNNRR